MKKYLLILAALTTVAFGQPTPLTGVKRVVAGAGISVSPTSGLGTVTVTATGAITASSTDTLTNKRITKRIETLTDAATVTPGTDSYDGGLLATLSQNTTLANPTGTPTNAQVYMLRVKSTSARTWTWDSQYRGSTDLALPTATTGSSLTDYYLFIYNSADAKWDLLAKTAGF